MESLLFGGKVFVLIENNDMSSTIFLEDSFEIKSRLCVI